MDEGEESKWFNMKTGVKHGCVLSGFPFRLVLDFIRRKATKDKDINVRWKFITKLEDGDFADDTVFVSCRGEQQDCKNKRRERGTESIIIGGQNLDETGKFVYCTLVEL